MEGKPAVVDCIPSDTGMHSLQNREATTGRSRLCGTRCDGDENTESRFCTRESGVGCLVTMDNLHLGVRSRVHVSVMPLAKDEIDRSMSRLSVGGPYSSVDDCQLSAMLFA